MAKIVYDDHYKTQNYFGSPYKGLLDFFESHTPKGKVLDLGCGQGRDAIPLAQMGYDVIAVDHSEVGIEVLRKVAKDKGLELQGLVGDVYTMAIHEGFDIVLLDSMLHFYKNDFEKERAFVERILNEIKEGGIFLNFIIKGESRQASLKKIIESSGDTWETLVEKYVDYTEASCQYHMLAIRKVKTIRK